MITKTYALGDEAIHGQTSLNSMTLCGLWVSDVKPMGPAAVTCGDCQAAIKRVKDNDALAAAFREAGVRVERVP